MYIYLFYVILKIHNPLFIFYVIFLFHILFILYNLCIFILLFLFACYGSRNSPRKGNKCYNENVRNMHLSQVSMCLLHTQMTHCWYTIMSRDVALYTCTWPRYWLGIRERFTTAHRAPTDAFSSRAIDRDANSLGPGLPPPLLGARTVPGWRIFESELSHGVSLI
jgi:hypothetical protein